MEHGSRVRRSQGSRPGGRHSLLTMLVMGSLGLLIGCADLGTEPASNGGLEDDGNCEATSTILLKDLVPDRTFRGDTVLVAGVGLGETQGEVAIRFPHEDGGMVAAQVLAWSGTEARVLVPDGAVSGDVLAGAGSCVSNGVTFSVAPGAVSYLADVDPILGSPRYGCKSCHGGSGGLFLETGAALLRGDSEHGPVVIPRRADQSPLVMKLRGTALFGDRVPLGGQMAEKDILMISDWIDQGARVN